MVRLPSFADRTAPWSYVVAAPLLLLSQPLLVLVIYRVSGFDLVPDLNFWLLPLGRLAIMPGLTAWLAALAFSFSLTVAWALSLLSFRRARWSGGGYPLAALTVIPGIQIAAVIILAMLPRFSREDDVDRQSGIDTAHVIQGVVAGVAIIVSAVLVSAVTFGAYGWALFVMTPLLVGVTTGYLANRRLLLTARRTAAVVLAAAALGTMALIMFALEGLICVLLATPLGALAALLGGAIGRAIARAGHSRNQPLMSVALLPALFVMEAAMPPAVSIKSQAMIDIAAPPSAVWQALTSDAPITSDPGAVSLAGLAYPIRGRLFGSGVGAIRLGEFSTGIARERVTSWVPGRQLGFVVLHQPPAMEEMSPYRRVHAPHVVGYFDTGDTRFTLAPIADGGTRLTVLATHVLRIDPALYWEPMARLAIQLNETRVLQDVRAKAEVRK